MEYDLSVAFQLGIFDLTILLKSLKLIRLGTKYSAAVGQTVLEQGLLIILRQSDSMAQVQMKVELMIICLRNYYTIKLKDKLLVQDINTKAIASNLRISKIVKCNPYKQSYKVLSFQSYCYLNYDLITVVVEVLIKECNYLRSDNTIPTILS